MDLLGQDIRYTWRTFRRRPGFTVVAILTLALGIGVNSAIFSVVNGVLLRPLPYEEPDELVMIWEDWRARGGPEREWWSYPDFWDTRELNTTLEEMAVFSGWAPTLATPDGALRISGGEVSSGYFRLLGVSAHLGRLFEPTDDVPGTEPFVILGYGFWQQHFGGNSDVLGQILEIDGRSYTVAGILPRSFEAPILGDLDLGEQDVWSTMMHDPVEGRGNITMRAIGRLKEGVEIDQARADMSSVAARLAEAYPVENSDVDFAVYPLHDEMVGDLATPLWIVMGTVGLVLLIACANVANLLLSRATDRRTEISVRIAMGAGRQHLIRQLLTESILMSLVGGALALLVALWGVDVLTGIIPASVPMPRLGEVGVNGSVLLFTLTIALATGVFFGLVPAVHSSRFDPSKSLKERSSQMATGSSGGGMRGLLVVLETAFALTALVGAALLLQSFLRLRKVDPGFDTENLLTFGVILPAQWYEDAESMRNFHTRALMRFSSIPGVVSAGAVSTLPLGANATDASFRIVGDPEPAPGHLPGAWYRQVSAGYLEMMHIPLKAGRFIDEGDRPGTSIAVVVNEGFVARYMPDGEAVGRRLQFGGDSVATIVGVAGDIRHFALDTEPPAAMYLSNRQFPSSLMGYALRTTGDPMSVAGAVRQALAEVDPKLAPTRLQTMDQMVADSVATERVIAMMISVFASLALVLAAVGLYGVISHTVEHRTQEIGVRMALGAGSLSVVGLVVRRGMLLTLMGVALGLAGGYGFARLMHSLLFGIGAFDPFTISSVVALLVAIALLSTWVPARRASRLDPVIALRYE
jgi:putative ABC transport system permease protein